MDKERVIVVGGGWAGMAATLELQRHGVPVTLLESAKQLGGRARTVSLDGLPLDNGQHLLIGAYHETLRLLQGMGISESDVLLRQPLQLNVLHREMSLTLGTGPLPAPLHLLLGLITARGLSSAEKYRAIFMSLKLALSGYRLERDISVAELLGDHRQGERITALLWEPLCLATLNTPMQKASARVFLRVLQESFSRHRHDADLLIPRIPLGALFCEAAAAYLEREDSATVSTRRRVSALSVAENSCNGVVCDAEQLPAGDVILATGPEAAARLLEPLPQTAGTAANLQRLGAQPITTLYLHYPDAAALQSPMLGLSGTVSQWLFDRRVCGQPGWFAVVISAEGEHNNWDRHYLVETVEAELAQLLPGWPARAERHHIIREQRATFECRVGIEELRPDNTLPLKQLWLAGDYTDTGYPGTLEGAVRSGVECARKVIAARRTHH